MRASTSRLFATLTLLASISQPSAQAMNMPSYDLNSLVYMSTDIVVATLAEDSAKNFTATVTESLYGSIAPGEKLDKLTPFLMFFRPMEDGMRVVLFLDRRPHQYDFFHQDAAKSPFAVPPSGVFLIDEFEHVHRYYQLNNPGPYVAQGYWDTPRGSIPTKEQDLALPSLDGIREDIATSVKRVQPVRALLDKVATREDVPALLHLVDATSQSRLDCELRTAKAIGDRAMSQIRSLNDDGLLLQATVLRGYASSTLTALDFVDAVDAASVGMHVEYLIRTLSNPKEQATLRTAAVQVLFALSGFRSSPGYVPSTKVASSNPWLVQYALEITSVATAIFVDDSQNLDLRLACLPFLVLEQPEMAAEAKHVYERTKSEELRYAIEDAFLKVGDDLYGSLNAPGGIAASIVRVETLCGCAQEAPVTVVFLAKYHERKDFFAPWVSEITQMARSGGGVRNENHHTPVLTNVRTRQRIVLKHVQERSGWNGGATGEFSFAVPDLSNIPRGRYSLALDYSSANKIMSDGYGVIVTIKETAKGKELSVDQPASSKPKKLRKSGQISKE